MYSRVSLQKLYYCAWTRKLARSTMQSPSQKSARKHCLWEISACQLMLKRIKLSRTACVCNASGGVVVSTSYLCNGDSYATCSDRTSSMQSACHFLTAGESCEQH